MRLEWKIKPSNTCTATIVLLSMTPVIISISIQQANQVIGLVILLSLLMLFLLSSSTNLTLLNPSKQLTWEDRHWSFNNKEMTITGVQSKHSFSLGLMLFLRIESADGQSITLWLFPDNLQNNTALESRHIKWHHLHCCFHLSS
ncbi:MAG: hypothetical protein ACI9N9_001114 [Enterobacterales bacterium]|jgi:hypothetical protein